MFFELIEIEASMIAMHTHNRLQMRIGECGCEGALTSASEQLLVPASSAAHMADDVADEFSWLV